MTSYNLVSGYQQENYTVSQPRKPQSSNLRHGNINNDIGMPYKPGQKRTPSFSNEKTKEKFWGRGQLEYVIYF
jgi:hypothetical protein